MGKPLAIVNNRRHRALMLFVWTLPPTHQYIYIFICMCTDVRSNFRRQIWLSNWRGDEHLFIEHIGLHYRRRHRRPKLIEESECVSGCRSTNDQQLNAIIGNRDDNVASTLLLLQNIQTFVRILSYQSI